MTRRIIDLTHAITPDMTVFPGSDRPVLEQAATVAADHYAEKRITILSHIGTHLDAPAHIIEGGATLSDLPADAFVGPACVLDVRGRGRVEIADLRQYAQVLEKSEFAVLRTGWEEHWGTPRYFEGFPVLGAEAADWLASFGLKGVAVDAISVDPVGPDLTVHRALLGKGLVVIENLRSLAFLPSAGFLLSVLPLNIPEGDGSPVRAVGMLLP